MKTKEMSESMIIIGIILIAGMSAVYAQEGPVCEPGQIILNGKCADPDEITREELIITLNADSAYSIGDTIHITGTVSRIDSDYHVTVLVTNPADDIVLVKQLPPKSNGDFEVTTQAKGPLWQISGTYQIVASYDNKKAATSFVYDGPQPAPKTKQVEQPKTEEAELNTEEPEKKEKLPVAQFVDERKDPKDYIERYRTEPDYKDWFERNYSEYDSIYEAVGLPNWVDRLFDWKDSNTLSEYDVSNAIDYLKSKN